MQQTNEPLESASAVAAARAAERSPSWLATFREAFAGSRQDFTEGNIRRAIVLLAVPMVLETAMESLFGIVNVFWVAHLGKESAAAVGITLTLVMLVITLGINRVAERGA